MRVGILISTRGGSPLQYSLCHYGWELYRPGQVYDLVLVFNQTAHTRDYRYPDSLPDGPIAFVDTAEYGTTMRPWHGLTPEAMAHDTKNAAEQARLRSMLEGRSFPYFLRETWIDRGYSEAFHPIDYPLHPGAEPTRAPDRDEYLARSVPVACIWGHSNACRPPITEALRSVPGADVFVVDQDGPRLPFDVYARRLEAARCTVSADGYGSGSFRVTESLVRTMLVRRPPLIRQHAPLVHGQTCIDFWNDPVGALNVDAERAFEIYARGYDHCLTHYTPAATAARILAVCEAHDWSKPTCL